MFLSFFIFIGISKIFQFLRISQHFETSQFTSRPKQNTEILVNAKQTTHIHFKIASLEKDKCSKKKNEGIILSTFIVEETTQDGWSNDFLNNSHTLSFKQNKESRKTLFGDI